MSDPTLPKHTVNIFTQLLFAYMTLPVYDALGIFQLQILSIQNSDNRLWSGECCTGLRSTPTGSCVDECRTVVSMCLGEYQSTPRRKEDCLFGNASAGIWEGSNYSIRPLDDVEVDAETVLSIPFDFRWTVSIGGLKKIDCFSDNGMH